MRKAQSFATAGLVLLLSQMASATFIQSFDSGAGNFKYWDLNNNIFNPTYSSTGGNLDGYISAPVTNSQNQLYSIGPTSTTGFGDLTNHTLGVDFKISGTVTAPSTAFVRFYVGSYTGGSNYFVSNDAYSWNPNLDTDWTSHFVAMIADNFIRWPISDSNSKTFNQVIAAPDDIGLVFTSSAGNFSSSYLGFASLTGATISIDNFAAYSSVPVPEPSPLVLTLAVLTCSVVRPRRSAIRC